MNQRGITLIELLVTLVISSILVAGIYRTFLSQQHTFTVQEQVVDMQQNVRIAINQMVREIRMAGFGRIDSKTYGASGMHGIYKNIVTPSDDGTSVTVVAAYQEMTTLAANVDLVNSPDKIQVDNASGFNLVKRQYICINGTESRRIKSINGNQIELYDNLTENHFAGELIFRILAITYSLGVFEGKSALLRNENLGSGAQPVAENIESLRFMYTLKDGSVYWDTVPGALRDQIRMVQVTLRARTDRNDPDLSGDGFRRRTLTSNIQLRNLSFL
jgi:prepilin-type N-terminal cleavage/methylation domain-containing protein